MSNRDQSCTSRLSRRACWRPRFLQKNTVHPLPPAHYTKSRGPGMGHVWVVGNRPQAGRTRTKTFQSAFSEKRAQRCALDQPTSLVNQQVASKIKRRRRSHEKHKQNLIPAASTRVLPPILPRCQRRICSAASKITFQLHLMYTRHGQQQSPSLGGVQRRINFVAPAFRGCRRLPLFSTSPGCCRIGSSFSPR